MRKALKRNLVLVCTANLVTLAALLGSTGCGQKESVTGRLYTVRAQVVQPPDSATGLYLYHEAIDDWVGRDGKVTGMDTMAMPFPVAKGVPLGDIQANDKVEVTLKVEWSSDRPVEITAVRELPPETKLVFRAAKPPQ